MRDLIKANAGLLFAGVASFILMGAGQSIYGPALPAFSRSFDISVSTAGFLVSAHWIGCAFGVGMMYLYAQIVTPRHVLALMMIGAGLVAFAPNFAVTSLGAIFFGAGYGAATVVFNPRVLRAFGPRGPAMLSLLNASFGIGAIAAPLVFVALSSDTRATFLVFTALIAAVWLFARDTEAAVDTAQAPPKTRFQPHWPILVFHAFAIGLEASMIGLGPTALIRAGLAEVRAAELLSLFFIGFLAARVALIFLAHKVEAMTLASFALAGTAISALISGAGAPSIGFVAMGFFGGTFFPCMYVAASGTMQGHPRTAVAIIAAGMVGGITAPILLSPILPLLGDVGFFWLIAGVAGLMALLGVTAQGWLLAKGARAPAP
jgi:MFS transporter, FHS family, glucose/mannose:H+ symporter